MPCDFPSAHGVEASGDSHGEIARERQREPEDAKTLRPEDAGEVDRTAEADEASDRLTPHQRKQIAAHTRSVQCLAWHRRC